MFYAILLIVVIWIAIKVLFTSNPHANLNNPLTKVRHRSMANIRSQRRIKKMRGY
jgi:hypothetical protein